MGPLDVLFHLLNFLAPALVVAVLLAFTSLLFMKRKPFPSVIGSQAAINFIVGAVVLAGGLALLGRDGKMSTYLVLVLAMATSQWWQRGGWRK